MGSSGVLKSENDMQSEAVRQGSEASEIFSLDLSSNTLASASLRRKLSGSQWGEAADGDEAADIQRLCRLLRPQTDFEAQLLDDVRMLKPHCSAGGEGGGTSVAALGRALAAQGYLVSVREAQPRECGKACGRHCLEKLQHTYIVVSGSLGSAVTAPVIVEAQFREHFQLAHATPAFAQLLGAAPAELAATSARLAQLVELLSGAVAEAFRVQGLPLPPWRKLKSVLSKWGLPPPSHDARQGGAQTASPAKRAAAEPPSAAADALQQLHALRHPPPRARRLQEGLVQVPGMQGMGAMLQGVACAELAPGKRQALEVLRRSAQQHNPGADGSALCRGNPPPAGPVVVSLSAHASADMPAQPDGTQLSGIAPLLAHVQPQLCLAEPAISDGRTGNPVRLRGGSVVGPDGHCTVIRPAAGHAGVAGGGGKQRGEVQLQQQQQQRPPKEEQQRVVSLLAQRLASQKAAEAAAGPPHVEFPAAAAATTGRDGSNAAKQWRTHSSWLLGLPHITTVRRQGRAAPDGA